MASNAHQELLRTRTTSVRLIKPKYLDFAKRVTLSQRVTEEEAQFEADMRLLSTHHPAQPPNTLINNECSNLRFSITTINVHFGAATTS